MRCPGRRRRAVEVVAGVVGGIVPDEDEKMLLEHGVAHVFHPGSSRNEIVTVVGELVPLARAQRDAG